MRSAMLESLLEILSEDVDGLSLEDEGLSAVIDGRFGEVILRIREEELGTEPNDPVALRVEIAVPSPAGGGRSLLLFLLAANQHAWGACFGLSEEGMLVAHADLDLAHEKADEEISDLVIDRIESVLQLIDEELVEFALAHHLGTPAQRMRWTRRVVGGAFVDEEEEDIESSIETSAATGLDEDDE